MNTSRLCRLFFFFFFNDTATTEIYTLSLHDALPISAILSRLKITSNLDIAERRLPQDGRIKLRYTGREIDFRVSDRKSTRLNSSHSQISYAVFCLKKKKTRA